jgi:hypothetical protein
MVKIIRLESGEEIIAKVTETTTDDGVLYNLKDACVLVPTQEGKLMFVKWIPYASVKDGISILKSKTVFVVDPQPELEDHFTSVITNDLFVPSKKVVKPELTLST